MGGPGGPEPPRILADQLTLFEPGWADFAPHNTVSPPGFKKLSTPLSLLLMCNLKGCQTKGQLISECPFGVFKSLRKFHCFFLGDLTPKGHFETN